MLNIYNLIKTTNFLKPAARWRDFLNAAKLVTIVHVTKQND